MLSTRNGCNRVCIFWITRDASKIGNWGSESILKERVRLKLMKWLSETLWSACDETVYSVRYCTGLADKCQNLLAVTSCICHIGKQFPSPAIYLLLHVGDMECKVSAQPKVDAAMAYKINRLNYRCSFSYSHTVHGYWVINWRNKDTTKCGNHQLYILTDFKHHMTFPRPLSHDLTHTIVWLISSFEINCSTSQVLLTMKYKPIPDMDLYCGYSNSPEFAAAACSQHGQSHLRHGMSWLTHFNSLFHELVSKVASSYQRGNVWLSYPSLL